MEQPKAKKKHTVAKVCAANEKSSSSPSVAKVDDFSAKDALLCSLFSFSTTVN